LEAERETIYRFGSHRGSLHLNGVDGDERLASKSLHSRSQFECGLSRQRHQWLEIRFAN
jgi:hypothetical protein